MLQSPNNAIMTIWISLTRSSTLVIENVENALEISEAFSYFHFVKFTRVTIIHKGVLVAQYYQNGYF